MFNDLLMLYKYLNKICWACINSWRQLKEPGVWIWINAGNSCLGAASSIPEDHRAGNGKQNLLQRCFTVCCVLQSQESPRTVEFQVGKVL